MKPRILLTIMLYSAVLLFLNACSLDPDRKLNNAIERYNRKEPNALQDLENEFIKNIAIDSINSTDFLSSGTLLYTAKDNSAEVIYPSKQKFTLTDEGPVIAIDRNDDYAVISDGLKLSIFDGSGNHLNDETVGEKKNRVKAVLIQDDSVVYYKNGRLYRYSILHRTIEQFLKDSFPPPYANYYMVHLVRRDDLLQVTSGIAGSHSFNLVNLATGATVLKNLGMSSSKHHMGVTVVRYITGNSGNWELMQYSIDTKVKKSLARLTDIVDIELVSKGYVMESPAGLWAAEYGKDRKRIPFSYRLAGKYKGRVILQYQDASYIIDMNKLISGLARLTEKTPDLFTPPKQ